MLDLSAALRLSMAVLIGTVILACFRKETANLKAEARNAEILRYIKTLLVLVIKLDIHMLLIYIYLYISVYIICI